MTDNERTLPTMEQIEQTMRSRRDVLLGTGAAVALGVAGTAAAQQDGDGAAGNQPVEVPPQFDQPNTDVDILNYALTLEYLEDAFYTTGLDMFSGDDLAAASAVDIDPETVLGEFEQIGEHEQSHTEQLTRVIETLGVTPVEPPEVEFGLESAEGFLATAQVLENTGVGAYAGAAPRIESPDILSAALSIHSVEARHAARLNELTGESPFPDAYDPAIPIPEVLTAVGPFIASGMGEMPEEPGEVETPAENGTEAPAENGTETTAGDTATESGGENTDTS